MSNHAYALSPASERCGQAKRNYKSCSCPIWVQGTLNGKPVRYSLDLTSWEAAVHRIRELEIHGDAISAAKCCESFLGDRKDRVGAAMYRKYETACTELEENLGKQSIRSVTMAELRKLIKRWKLAPITKQKRLENVRKFFSCCVDSDWIKKNLAKKIESIPAILQNRVEPPLNFQVQPRHPRPFGASTYLVGAILVHDPAFKEPLRRAGKSLEAAPLFTSPVSVSLPAMPNHAKGR